MAKIILGAAAPRGPQLRIEPDRWSELGERDKTSPWLFDVEGNRLSYDEVLSSADPSVLKEITTQKWQDRYRAGRTAMQRVRQAFANADPDVVLVMGDDENEWFRDDDTRPKLAIYRGASWPWGEERTIYPVATDITNHVIEYLQNAGYEIRTIDAVPEGALMPHCFGNVHTDLMHAVKPIVPIMVNIHYPVNQTSPVWSYQLGRAVRQAIESWQNDATVAVVGIGGLSIGVLREELDRRYLEALKNRDVAALESLPYRWIKGPAGELYNWIGAAGVLEGLEMQIVDYLPAYRSPAGTGCGMAFATWQ